MSFFIRNANSKPLSQQGSTLPNMSETLSDWYQNIIFIKVKKITQNFELIETNIEISFQGIVEGMNPTDLAMKPEGQRKWEWIVVWTGGEIDLNVDEIFQYRSKKYRVMKKNDWAVYGYQNFEAVEDYTR